MMGIEHFMGKEYAKKSEEKSWEDIILLLVMGVILMGVGMAAYGHVLSTMWGWFVVPLGLPQISLMHSYGLCLLIALASSPVDYMKRETPSETMLAIGMGICDCVVRPYFVLLIGYIAHYVMLMP
jgi:hypothetical protein